MAKTTKVRWSSYVTLGAVDSLVTVSGVLSGITFGSSISKLVIVSGAVAVGFATAIALFFAVYLNAKKESHSDNPFPMLPPPGKALAKGAGTAITAMAVSVFVVSPFFILAVFDAFLVSIVMSLASLFVVGWFRGDESMVRRRQRFRTALETLSIGVAAMIIARFVSMLIALVISA